MPYIRPRRLLAASLLPRLPRRVFGLSARPAKLIPLSALALSQRLTMPRYVVDRAMVRCMAFYLQQPLVPSQSSCVLCRP